MSYSFDVTAETKAEAIAKVRDELAQIVSAQPAHAIDSETVQGTAEAFIELLPDDPAQDVDISVNGSITSTDAGVTQVSCAINLQLKER